MGAVSICRPKKGTYVDALDPKQQWPGKARNSVRHRVRDNLPGTPDFCPLVRRTANLEAFAALDLPARAKDIAALVPARSRTDCRILAS